MIRLNQFDINIHKQIQALQLDNSWEFTKDQLYHSHLKHTPCLVHISDAPMSTINYYSKPHQCLVICPIKVHQSHTFFSRRDFILWARPVMKAPICFFVYPVACIGSDIFANKECSFLGQNLESFHYTVTSQSFKREAINKC